MPADPRRQRLHEGVRHRARVARHPAEPDRRGHRRDHARGHRALLRALVGKLLEHVRGYYDALNRGDADEVAPFFTDDATHYYTRRDPHHGRAIAENAELGVKHIDAQWILEHGIENGEEVVI